METYYSLSDADTLDRHGLADHLGCSERIKRCVNYTGVTVFILIDKVLIDIDAAEDQRINILSKGILDHVRLVAAENYLVTVRERRQIAVYGQSDSNVSRNGIRTLSVFCYLTFDNSEKVKERQIGNGAF